MTRSSVSKSKATRSRARVTAASVGVMERWKLEDAKARFSEVVRLAASSGPQLVTVRGKEAAVVLAADEYRKLLPAPKSRLPLVDFLRDLGLNKLSLERDADTGRDVLL